MEKCDLCNSAYAGPGKNIEKDWDHSYVKCCSACVSQYGEYAISCSHGSLKKAQEIRAAEIARISY